MTKSNLVVGGFRTSGLRSKRIMKRSASHPLVFTLGWVSLGSLFVVFGCGSNNHGQVTGKIIRQDGSPLVHARIIARSDATGKSAYDTTDADGTYHLSTVQPGDGIPAGDYNIVIIEDTGDFENRKPATITAKYADPAKSGLKLRVGAGEDKELNITVDSK